MDLERCPKCGGDWRGGEKCRSCGFVPIGAGLDKLPKRKKRRNRRYVEPGSWRGFLSFASVGGLAYFCVAYKPWKDDWEFFRALIGQGRRHSVMGEWEIVKAVTLGKGAPIMAGNVNKGVLRFTDKGMVKFDLHRGEQTTAADGKYEVQGQLVAMNGIQTSDAGAGPLPSSLKLSLAWTGPDTVIASCNGAEALYMRRHDKKGGIANLIHLGLKGGDVNEAPQGVKDLADSMTKGAREAGKEND